MEPGNNVNRPLADQWEQKPNPPKPPNINNEIDEGLDTLRTLVDQLRGTIKTSKVSLANSLGVIVRSTISSQGELTYISEYRKIMFDYYNTWLDRNQVRDLGISKQ
jgi:hypothetical protein